MWKKETKASWLAAMIDADGWITIPITRVHTRDGKPRIAPRIGITNACKDIQDFAAEIVGVKHTVTKNKNIGRDYRGIKTNASVTEFYWSSAPRIIAVLDIIEPYLIRKKKQAELMRVYCERRITKNGSVHRASRRYTMKDFQIAEQMSALNGRVTKWEPYLNGEQVLVRERIS